MGAPRAETRRRALGIWVGGKEREKEQGRCRLQRGVGVHEGESGNESGLRLLQFFGGARERESRCQTAIRDLPSLHLPPLATIAGGASSLVSLGWRENMVFTDQVGVQVLLGAVCPRKGLKHVDCPPGVSCLINLRSSPIQARWDPLLAHLMHNVPRSNTMSPCTTSLLFNSVD